jgi:hypothetical protein
MDVCTTPGPFRGLPPWTAPPASSNPATGVLHDDDFTIVANYQTEYRGLVQYYLLAQDVFRLGTLRWVLETSMLKTLAGKHKSTVTKSLRS